MYCYDVLGILLVSGLVMAGYFKWTKFASRKEKEERIEIINKDIGMATAFLVMAQISFALGAAVLVFNKLEYGSFFQPPINQLSSGLIVGALSFLIIAMVMALFIVSRRAKDWVAELIIILGICLAAFSLADILARLIVMVML